MRTCRRLWSNNWGQSCGCNHPAAQTASFFFLKNGNVHWIPRTYRAFNQVRTSSVYLYSFPFRLCFDVTAHRISQGQALDRVVFDLRRDVFMRGCLYVGLMSRVRNSASTIVLTNEDGRCAPAKKSVLSPRHRRLLFLNSGDMVD